MYELIRSASALLCDDRSDFDRLDLPNSNSRIAQLSVHSWLALIERLWGNGGNNYSGYQTDKQSFGNQTFRNTC